MAEAKLEEVIGKVEYLMSYEAAAPPDGGSEGVVQVKVNELVCKFENCKLEIAEGGCVSEAETVVKVLSIEVAKSPAAFLDLTL